MLPKISHFLLYCNDKSMLQDASQDVPTIKVSEFMRKTPILWLNNCINAFFLISVLAILS